MCIERTLPFMTLKDYMAEAGLLDAQLATLVGCDRSTIYRIRNGQTVPTPALMASIAKETGGKVQPNDYFPGLADAA